MFSYMFTLLHGLTYLHFHFRYIVSGCETGKLFMFSSTTGKHLDIWENNYFGSPTNQIMKDPTTYLFCFSNQLDTCVKCTFLNPLCQLWPKYIAPGRETQRFHMHLLMFLLLQQLQPLQQPPHTHP